jgi:hypothetical protein
MYVQHYCIAKQTYMVYSLLFEECCLLGCGTLWVYYKQTFIFRVEKVTRGRESVRW